MVIPGWDGVFYGWTPEHVAAFGRQFRALAPNGYLGIEHNQGHIPIGNGPVDYAPGGPMQAYDIVYGEFNNWPATGDVVWQVLGRMLGPQYRRDPRQPPGDDPSPPWYLRASSPRGPIYYDCFEYAEFDWVRGRVTATAVADARAYYRARGCTIVD